MDWKVAFVKIAPYLMRLILVIVGQVTGHDMEGIAAAVALPSFSSDTIAKLSGAPK